MNSIKIWRIENKGQFYNLVHAKQTSIHKYIIVNAVLSGLNDISKKEQQKL